MFDALFGVEKPSRGNPAVFRVRSPAWRHTRIKSGGIPLLFDSFKVFCDPCFGKTTQTGSMLVPKWNRTIDSFFAHQAQLRSTHYLPRPQGKMISPRRAVPFGTRLASFAGKGRQLSSGPRALPSLLRLHEVASRLLLLRLVFGV